jgi:hypothetical protein
MSSSAPTEDEQTNGGKVGLSARARLRRMALSGRREQECASAVAPIRRSARSDKETRGPKPQTPWAKRATIITSHRQNSAMRSAASASSALTRGFDSYFNRYLVSSEYTGCRSEDSEESELATIPDLADIVKKR